MSWLKHTISLALLLAAAVVVLATLFSGHSDDYGRVSLPQGGTVHLPKGEVIVYDSVQGDPDQLENNTSRLTFAVVPAGGGESLSMSSPNDQLSETSVTRAQTIGEVGAIAKLDVPSAGDYLVNGTAELAPGTFYLEFGTNAGSALVGKWKLIAGLLLGALLVALIPVPRSRRRLEGEPSAWSSDPRAPYAG
jgi:hypothetical protein